MPSHFENTSSNTTSSSNSQSETTDSIRVSPKKHASRLQGLRQSPQKTINNITEMFQAHKVREERIKAFLKEQEVARLKKQAEIKETQRQTELTIRKKMEDRKRQLQEKKNIELKRQQAAEQRRKACEKAEMEKVMTSLKRYSERQTRAIVAKSNVKSSLALNNSICGTLVTTGPQRYNKTGSSTYGVNSGSHYSSKPIFAFGSTLTTPRNITDSTFNSKPGIRANGRTISGRMMSSSCHYKSASTASSFTNTDDSKFSKIYSSSTSQLPLIPKKKSMGFSIPYKPNKQLINHTSPDINKSYTKPDPISERPTTLDIPHKTGRTRGLASKSLANKPSKGETFIISSHTKEEVMRNGKNKKEFNAPKNRPIIPKRNSLNSRNENTNMGSVKTTKPKSGFNDLQQGIKSLDNKALTRDRDKDPTSNIDYVDKVHDGTNKFLDEDRSNDGIDCDKSGTQLFRQMDTNTITEDVGAFVESSHLIRSLSYTKIPADGDSRHINQVHTVSDVILLEPDTAPYPHQVATDLNGTYYHDSQYNLHIYTLLPSQPPFYVQPYSHGDHYSSSLPLSTVTPYSSQLDTKIIQIDEIFSSNIGTANETNDPSFDVSEKSNFSLVETLPDYLPISLAHDPFEDNVAADAVILRDNLSDLSSFVEFKEETIGTKMSENNWTSLNIANKVILLTEEEAKAEMMRKRKEAKESARIRAEIERRKLEEEKAEEMRIIREEQQEMDRLAEVAKELEERRLALAIEEHNKKLEEENSKQKLKELEQKKKLEEIQKVASQKLQKIDEEARQKEEERIARKKKLDSIMARTRNKNNVANSLTSSNQTSATLTSDTTPCILRGRTDTTVQNIDFQPQISVIETQALRNNATLLPQLSLSSSSIASQYSSKLIDSLAYKNIVCPTPSKIISSPDTRSLNTHNAPLTNLVPTSEPKRDNVSDQHHNLNGFGEPSFRYTTNLHGHSSSIMNNGAVLDTFDSRELVMTYDNSITSPITSSLSSFLNECHTNSRSNFTQPLLYNTMTNPQLSAPKFNNSSSLASTLVQDIFNTYGSQNHQPHDDIRSETNGKLFINNVSDVIDSTTTISSSSFLNNDNILGATISTSPKYRASWADKLDILKTPTNLVTSPPKPNIIEGYNSENCVDHFPYTTSSPFPPSSPTKTSSDTIESFMPPTFFFNTTKSSTNLIHPTLNNSPQDTTFTARNHVIHKLSQRPMHHILGHNNEFYDDSKIDIIPEEPFLDDDDGDQSSLKSPVSNFTKTTPTTSIIQNNDPFTTTPQQLNGDDEMFVEGHGDKCPNRDMDKLFPSATNLVMM